MQKNIESKIDNLTENLKTAEIAILDKYEIDKVSKMNLKNSFKELKESLILNEMSMEISSTKKDLIHNEDMNELLEDILRLREEARTEFRKYLYFRKDLNRINSEFIKEKDSKQKLMAENSLLSWRNSYLLDYINDCTRLVESCFDYMEQSKPMKHIPELKETLNAIHRRLNNTLRRDDKMYHTTHIPMTEENLSNKDLFPLDPSVIPNHMGINLSSVKEMQYVRRDDGQLISLTIMFDPADVEDIEEV